jgi:hypothetical protein
MDFLRVMVIMTDEEGPMSSFLDIYMDFLRVMVIMTDEEGPILAS